MEWTGEVHLPVVLADDAAFDWIRPMPRPPTAPASNPSSTRSGTCSRIDLFLPDLDILDPQLVMLYENHFIIGISTGSYFESSPDKLKKNGSVRMQIYLLANTMACRLLEALDLIQVRWLPDAAG
jgi:hypothetical protein